MSKERKEDGKGSLHSSGVRTFPHQCRARFRRTRNSSGAPVELELARDAGRAGLDDAVRSSFGICSSPSVTPPASTSSAALPASSSSCLTIRARLREAFGVTSPSGLDLADREPTEADDRALARCLLRDALRGWLMCANDAERLLPGASASASDLPSSQPGDSASTSALLLLLLVRYAGRGCGRWGAGSCGGGATSSPDCSPDSSSLVANSLGLPGLPRGLDAAPESAVKDIQS